MSEDFEDIFYDEFCFIPSREVWKNFIAFTESLKDEDFGGEE